MKTIAQKEAEIISEFEQFNDIDSKYEYLFNLGAGLPPMDPSLKTDLNEVAGCQSKLWFYLSFPDGRAKLAAESDSLVINGITALLAKVIEGCPPEQIQDLSLDFIDQLDIWKLASKRNNGLVAMLAHIKEQARQYNSFNMANGQL